MTADREASLKKPFWNGLRLILAGIAVLALVVWIVLDLLVPAEGTRHLFLVALAIPLLLFLDWLSRRSTSGTLRDFLRNPRRYKVFDEVFPSYRYVDLFRSLERLGQLSRQSQRLEHMHTANLLPLIQDTSLLSPAKSQQTKICIGYEEHAFFPDQIFWLLEGPPGLEPEERVVLRLRSQNRTWVEVAARDKERADLLLKWLAADSLVHSIYRGQFLEVRYFHSPHDYEYTHQSSEMTVTFKAKPNVGDADIILEDKVRAILTRNVFDFFKHRDCLYSVGIPRKRALLFYGPPGTGKTHTCRHIHTRMEGVTSILVAGESLTRLQDVGKFARQMHPSLLVIEDVDLVFAAREHNPYGTILGELMDQLDGFAPDEEVMFILTTNAIERVEQAIRDRPGRINQCLYFGVPGPDLRRRYLNRYLRAYDIAHVDMDHLVKQTERTSQAFMKEFVLRAVQVAAAAAGYQMNGSLRMETGHFDTAFEELTAHGNPAGHAILGFRVEP